MSNYCFFSTKYQIISANQETWTLFSIKNSLSSLMKDRLKCPSCSPSACITRKSLKIRVSHALLEIKCDLGVIYTQHNRFPKIGKFMNGIVMDASSHITIVGSTINCQTCIYFKDCNNIQITDNAFLGSGVGVYGQGNNNNTITHNYVATQGTGINLFSSNYNNITKNLLKDQTALSIQLGEYHPCHYNIISDNIIENVNLGISVQEGSSNNAIFHNDINCNYSCILICNSQNNLFY